MMKKCLSKVLLLMCVVCLFACKKDDSNYETRNQRNIDVAYLRNSTWELKELTLDVADACFNERLKTVYFGESICYLTLESRDKQVEGNYSIANRGDENALMTISGVNAGDSELSYVFEILELNSSQNTRISMILRLMRINSLASMDGFGTIRLERKN